MTGLRGGLLLGTLLAPLGAVFAETETETKASSITPFNLLSPSLIGASQLYQLERLQLEALLGYTYGEMESKDILDAKSVIRGQNLGLNLNLPFPEFALVANLEVYSAVIDISGPGSLTEGQDTEVRTQFSYTPLPYLSLGGRLRLRLGSQESTLDLAEAGTLNATRRIKVLLPQLSTSFHRGSWEASLSYEPSYEKSSEPQNAHPASWALHGRYGWSPNVAFGLRLDWRRYGALSDSLEDELSDERVVTLIAENQWNHLLETEFALQSRTDGAGLPGNKENNLNVIGLHRLNEWLEAGLHLRYRHGASRSEDYAYLPLSMILRSTF